MDEETVMRRQSMRISVALVVLLCMVLVPSDRLCAREPGDETEGAGVSAAPADLSIEIIPSANNTFGYDILAYGKPLVHQPHIPGLPGNEGFTTRERARKVAEFVLLKIRNNEMPPTVTMADLNSMGVLK